MKKEKLIFLVIILVVVFSITGILVNKTKYRQVDIKTKNKTMIQKNGLEFKDLNANGKLDPYEDWRLSKEKRAENLLSQMTMEEKAGMLVINSQVSGYWQQDKTLTSHDGIINEAEASDEIKIYANYVGSTKTIEDLNIRHFVIRENLDPEEMATWINAMNEIAENTRLGIPMVATTNPINNISVIKSTGKDSKYTFYPLTLGLAAASLGEEKNNGSSNIIQEFAETVRRELSSMGIRKGYLYGIDVMTDPKWARNSETWGEDVNFVTKTASTLVKTIQGGKVLSNNGVALTMKHFPGSGARNNGYDAHLESGKYTPYTTENSLANYHLKPFQAAIDANVSAIMPYYSMPDPNSSKQTYKGKEINISENTSYTYSNTFLNDLLRKQMGFDGIINTDSGVIDFISWGEEDKSPVERIAKAMNAGVDLISDTNKVDWILEAYNNGLITEDTINNSVKKQLIEMFELGLFENPYVDVDYAKETVASEESLYNAYKVHQKSVVLLKNKEQTLPIKNDTTIKIYSEEYGTNKSIIYGSFGIDPKERIEFAENPEEADYFITYLCPKVTEEAIFDLDLTSTIDDYESWINKCKNIREKGGKTIVIVNFVTAASLDGIEEYADCILGGFNTYTDAIKDVILGKFNPIGVLPFTIPASMKVVEVDEDGNCASPNDVPGYDKSKYMSNGLKYEYIDETGNAYVCGFGLCY